MKNFIDTLKNIWSIETLRQRIIFTLALLLVYRLGSHILLPGISPSILSLSGTNDGLLGLLNSFTGGAFNNASILGLGVMPYISASIFVQVLGFAVPYFQRLQQREGESGRRTLNQITRFLTVIVAIFQGAGYLTFIQATYANNITGALPPYLFWVGNLLLLVSGTIFTMWIGERITDKGLGNGTSLIIMSGIVARLPFSFGAEIQSSLSGNVFKIVFVLFAFVVIVALTILLVQGVRRIPLEFAKRVVARGGTNMPERGERDFIPIKLNTAGVMPVIFGQALMFLPLTFLQFLGGKVTPGSWLASLSDNFSFSYNLIYFLLIVGFTYVYTALLLNPQQYAEFLKRQNAFIPGVKQGSETEEYIDNIVTRITLPGAVFLGILAILPAVAKLFTNQNLAMLFGGSSLIIMVGVILDTLQQIESQLLMQKYDGLMQSGKIMGRNTGAILETQG